MSALDLQFVASQRHLVEISPGVDMAFRYVPPGESQMGSRGNRRAEEPKHRVRIAHGFWLGETPVTQAQFAVWPATVQESHKNGFAGQPDHPAENMTWSLAVRYCRWLEERCGGQLPAGEWLVCLPTEMEWEYGCRAGSETEYYSGDGEKALADVGWYEKNAGIKTHAVTERAEAHPWGLLGMHGNVWEWCHDAWEEEAYRRRLDKMDDPWHVLRAIDYATRWKEMLEDVRRRVLRGGSWFDAPGNCRSASRDWWHPGGGGGVQGFRICLTPGPVAFSTTGGVDHAVTDPDLENRRQDSGPSTEKMGAAIE